MSKGYLIGPFNDIQFSNYRINPIGLAEHKYSKKKRLTVDLSSPHEDEDNPSLNELIDKEQFSLQYVSIDDATHIIKQLGQNEEVSLTSTTCRSRTNALPEAITVDDELIHQVEELWEACLCQSTKQAYMTGVPMCKLTLEEKGFLDSAHLDVENNVETEELTVENLPAVNENIQQKHLDFLKVTEQGELNGDVNGDVTIVNKKNTQDTRNEENSFSYDSSKQTEHVNDSSTTPQCAYRDENRETWDKELYPVELFPKKSQVKEMETFNPNVNDTIDFRPNSALKCRNKCIPVKVLEERDSYRHSDV
ncbi:unnamed protein product [Mytilus coruscus]|uniref:Uncharacterized protein n=1 Tax=Mytilus coruscus TaxID=42192 RepID=A0A6J8DGX6_MYTCO|nr:unnamed protein product [Mytilus coruscus]